MSNTKLFALNRGMLPLVSPMKCGDVVGPNSLMGEYCSLPRPIRHALFSDFLPLAKKECKSGCDSSFIDKLANASSLLWDGSHPSTNSSCAVVASTFLVGSCSSTFDLAWKFVENGLLAPWQSIIATSQDQGRGQLRRNWYSPQGNLYVTFRLPESDLFKKDSASVLLGILLVSVLRKVGFNVLLKWPNDIVTESCKKVGGLLLEEKNGILLAGLGINLTEVPEQTLLRNDHALQPAVLALAATEDNEDILAPFALWQSLVRQVSLEYDTSFCRKQAVEIFESSEDFLAFRGRRVLSVDEDISGLCLGLGENGGLLVCSGQGEKREFFSGSFIAAS